MRKHGARTYLDADADPPLGASGRGGPGHRLGRAQAPHPGREPPHRHLPRLLPRAGRRLLAAAATDLQLPSLTTAAAGHVPFQQRRGGPAPPPAAGRRGLSGPPSQPPRRP
jgi:hypothetical protein